MRPWPLLLALAVVVAACAAPMPSPVPSPSPVQASPNPNLVELETRLADASSRLGQLVRSLATASTGTPSELALVAGQLERFAADEIAWIEDHPADACFASAASAFRAAVDDLATAADAFIELAAAPAPPGDDAGRAAAQPLADGSTGLEQAAALATGARAACR